MSEKKQETFSVLWCDTRGNKKKFGNRRHSCHPSPMDDVAIQRWVLAKQVPLVAALRAAAKGILPPPSCTTKQRAQIESESPGDRVAF
jgi:hypothetical protein